MSKKYSPVVVDWATPPGDTILETIEFKGITQKELAARMGYSLKQVNQVVLGNAPVTPEFAILYERVIGTSAKTLLKLEALYQEGKAIVASNEQLEKDSEILKHSAIKELIKRGDIPKRENPVEQIDETLRFFGNGKVETLKESWGKPLTLALRHSTKFESDAVALAAWTRLGELQAQTIDCAPYSKEKFVESLKSIRQLTIEKPDVFIPKMIQICAESGVALAFVPELKGAKVSGATKWMTKNKALIILNLRGKKNDIFWFTFFHEAAHILFDEKKAFIVDVSGNKIEKSQKEQRADSFAVDMLIPKEYQQQLTSIDTFEKVKNFAEQIKIAPGIIVGHLQHRKLLRYDQLNRLKDTYCWTTV